MKNLVKKWLGIDKLIHENRFEELLKQFIEIKKLTDELNYWGQVKEGSTLHLLGTHLKAIEDYLKIDITFEWQDDPTRLPEPHPQIKVWKAYKRNTK
jgi:hypothetical protein